jgi:crotonobetainyl-CoA:carnitine CoA-transferase CaiB-like acyl-CoA transferase
LGAEVIKIENSEGNTPGDLMRHGGDSPTKQHGPIFTALNRNKKAINLNIKKPEDKAVLAALLEDADVFIHNVRMAGVERLGFGYEAVKAINAAETRERLAGIGGEPMTTTPTQSAAFIRDEMARWGKVIRDAGVKAE